MDILGITSLVGGVVQGVAAVADPYFYTDQEKAQSANTSAALTNQQQAINANVTIATAKEETNQKAITYGLAGVLGVSCIFLASKFVSGK